MICQIKRCSQKADKIGKKDRNKEREKIIENAMKRERGRGRRRERDRVSSKQKENKKERNRKRVRKKEIGTYIHKDGEERERGKLR